MRRAISSDLWVSMDVHVNESVLRWTQGYLFVKAAFRYWSECSWNRTKHSHRYSLLTGKRVFHYLDERISAEEPEIEALEMCCVENEAVEIGSCLQDNDRPLGKQKFSVRSHEKLTASSYYLADARADWAPHVIDWDPIEVRELAVVLECILEAEDLKLRVIFT